jgi:hypothetical protein
MNLLKALEEDVKWSEEADNKKHDIVLNLIKRMYHGLDIYSKSLIYIWQDDNRIKINMDGGTEKFHIKNGTKFFHIPSVTPETLVLREHIEKQITEFMKARDIDIYGFYMDSRKIIFKIKAFKKMDLEKCLY